MATPLRAAAGQPAQQLAEETAEPPARYAGDLDQSAAAASAMLEPGDVFFAMGAGDIEKVGPTVLETLERR